MGYIDLLARLTGDKRQELYLRNMKGSSEHLLALVNSLLDFYRLDINKIEVCCVAFSPAQLFETIRAGFAAAAAAKGTSRERCGTTNIMKNSTKRSSRRFGTI